LVIVNVATVGLIVGVVVGVEVVGVAVTVFLVGLFKVIEQPKTPKTLKRRDPPIRDARQSARRGFMMQMIFAYSQHTDHLISQTLFYPKSTKWITPCVLANLTPIASKTAIFLAQD